MKLIKKNFGKLHIFFLPIRFLSILNALLKFKREYMDTITKGTGIFESISTEQLINFKNFTKTVFENESKRSMIMMKNKNSFHGFFSITNQTHNLQMNN